MRTIQSKIDPKTALPAIDDFRRQKMRSLHCTLNYEGECSKRRWELFINVHKCTRLGVNEMNFGIILV